MADDRSIRVRLLADIASFRQGMAQAAAATKTFGQEMSGQGKAVRADVERVGRAAVVMAGGMAIALGGAAKAAIDWETAWAGVTKTVNGSASELSQLEGELRGLATTLPASHKEIASVAEAAGQLGIQRSAIAGFTETMVALGVSTNLTADQAATAIAQIENVMGTAQTDTDRFGATLVALGNAGASTESEILDMAQRLAGAGKLVGASEADVLALANALASMGIEAQLGGSAFSRVMRRVYTAVQSGGTELQKFASIAGTSALQFSQAFYDDPIRAIDSFVKGLGSIERSGGNVVETLADVGFKGSQDLDVLLRLKGAGDLLTDSLDLGSQAWQDNVALQKEAQKRYETTASKLSILRNNVVDVGIDLGGVMLPALKGTTDLLSTMVAGMGNLDGAAGTAVVGLGGFLTVLTGGVGLLGTLGPKVKGFKDSLSEMGGLGATVADNLGMITGIVGGLGVALAVYTYAVGENAKKQAEAAARAKEYADAIEEQGEAIGRATDELALKNVMDGKLGERLRTTGIDLSRFLDFLRTTGPAASAAKDDLIALRDAAEFRGDQKPWEEFFRLLDHGALESAPALRDELIRMQREGFGGQEISDFIERLLREQKALEDGQREARNKAAAEDTAAEATEAHGEAIKSTSKMLEDEAKKQAEAADAIRELIDAQRAAIDPLFGMLDATKGNRDAQHELAKALKEGGHSVQEIDDLQLAAAKSAADMDAAATDLAGSIAIGKVNLDDAKASLQSWVDNGLISQDTADQMAIKFENAAEKADAIAGERVATFRADIEQFEKAVDDARRRRDQLLYGPTYTPSPQLPGLGTPVGPSPRQLGGIDLSFAGGGTTPAHIAAGTRIKYAEPATGGEAYVPRYGDPARSMGILRTAAGWYGADVVPMGGMFHGGGGAAAAAPGVAVRDSRPVVVQSDVYLDGRKVGAMLKKVDRTTGGL